MPIEKTTPTKLQRRGDTYVTLPSSTIALIQNPEALAILAFLLDRPSDWIIRRDHIRERFNLGRDRYERAMRELHGLGLAWKEQDRNENGHITNTSLCVSAIPANDSPYIQKNRNTVKTATRENPKLGKSDHLHSTDLFTQNISPQGEAKPGPRQLDPGWLPSDELLQRAVDLGYSFPNFDDLVREFRDYWISTKKRKGLPGWDRTFMNRLKAEFNRQQTGGYTHGKKQTASQLLAEDLNKTLQAGASA